MYYSDFSIFPVIVQYLHQFSANSHEILYKESLNIFEQNVLLHLFDYLIWSRGTWVRLKILPL